jgi:hypothetical protein
LCDLVYGRGRFSAAVDLDMQQVGCRGCSRYVSSSCYYLTQDTTYVG